MTLQQIDVSDASNLEARGHDMFVIGVGSKVYVASAEHVYDRTDANDAEALAVLERYFDNRSADPVKAAVLRVQNATVMQAVEHY